MHCTTIFSVRIRSPPCSKLFPYTTLFRSSGHRLRVDAAAERSASVVSDPDERPRPRRSEPQLSRHRGGVRRCEADRSEEHTSELQSPCKLVCRLLLEKKNDMLKSTETVAK